MSLHQGARERQAAVGEAAAVALHSYHPYFLADALEQHGMEREQAIQAIQAAAVAVRAARAVKKPRVSTADALGHVPSDLVPRGSTADALGHVPSDLVLWDVWSKYLIGPSPMFKCHRPVPPPIPLVLLHKPFMDFVSNLGTETQPSAEDVSFASNFWAALNDDMYVQDHETHVSKVVTPLIKRYFRTLSHQVFAMPEANIDGVTIDILFIKSPGAPLFCELKSQPSAGEPGFQNASYFHRFWENEAMPSIEQYALLLNVYGPQMVEVVAASIQEDGKVVWAEIVASFRCFATSAGRMHKLTQAARVWRAIKSFVAEYDEQVKQQGWPVPWCLQGYSNVQQPNKTKLFFTYTDIDGISKAAKLSRMYCKEAHEAWHASGYAPALDGVDVIGHGWLCIRMEYSAPAKQWCSALDVAQGLKKIGRDQALDKLKSCLRAAASAGHSLGFVHGDLRLCNLLVKTGSGADGFEVHVLDFDWSGKVGHTRYQTQLNPDVKWSPGVEYNGIIEVDHDMWFLGDGFADQLA